MDPFTLPLLSDLLSAAYLGVVQLAALLHPIAGASAAACAIVLLTVLVRAALIPAGIAQARAEQIKARLAPALAALQRRHRNDRERLQRETMRLYADEHASPFAGCLPVVIQAPVVALVFALFLHSTIGGAPNHLLTESLLGVPLGTTLVGLVVRGGLDPASIAVFGAVIAATALVAELTRRVLRPAPLPPDAAPAAVTVAEYAGVVQYTTAVTAMFLPLAAGLYLAVTVAWTLVQRLLLRRRFPLPR